MKMLPPGPLVHVHTTTPAETHTAAAIGNTGIAVVSTPHVIALLEEASHRCVRTYFEEGEASVGTRVNIAHLAPAYPGQPVQAHATLTQVTGRRLQFDVMAEQAGKTIMSGTHERALIRTDKFLAPPPSSVSDRRSPLETSSHPDKAIDFFFDYHSPWCYLAAERIAGVAREAGRSLRWRPFHLAQLIERIGGRRPLDANPAFVRWFRQDMQDCAAVQGLALRYHPNFPLRPSRALRASAYAQNQGRAEPFVRAMMKAYWCDGGDISDLDCIGQTAAAVGLDEEETRAACADPFYKRSIEDNTQAAIDLGVFGAPSFVVDGQLFWGNDRIDMLARYLRSGLASRP